MRTLILFRCANKKQFLFSQLFYEQISPHIQVDNITVNQYKNQQQRQSYKMTYSPSRKIHTNYLSRKQSYTQNRQQNINQANLSQYSPSIRSPKLNQESQYTKLHNVGMVEQLKLKLDTVLKHNSHLLNQNATLSEMVNNLKIQLELRSRRQQTETVKISVQYTTIIEQLRESLRIKQSQMARLLDQISRLHDQCYKIQMIKGNEIKQLKESHEREMAIQIRNIKKSSEDNKQLTELQIRKLKQSLELKNFEHQALKSTSKGETDKLRAEIQEYRTQISHFNQLKQLQVRQITQKYKQIINTNTKSSERQKAISMTKLQNKIKKLKQDINNKNVEIQQTHKKAVVNSEDHQIEIENLNMERQRLLEEINELQMSSKQNIHKQKAKIRELSELEIKNLENIAQNERDLFKSQINKLISICNAKTEQIKKLYNNIAQIKERNLSEKHDNDKLIQELRKRIKNLEQDSLEEIELLKIKMAELHHADIKGLEKYYESQLAILAKYIKELEEGRLGDRNKLHNLLQQNDLLRKTFDTELTKYKAKIQDYKVKFAAAHLQFRQQITSIGTKMELTSQTLLRQTEQKQKGAQFFENEKKKFHMLIQGKDKEISSAYEAMSKLKQMHGEQIKQLREEILGLREGLASKTKQLKDLRKQFEDQFERKSQKILEERKQTPNQLLEKENKQLRDRVQKLEKDLFQKIKQIQFMQRENKSLQQEVGLRAGFLQTMQLQSSAAIQDQRSKLKILMNENQVAMKDYYESKLTTKSKDIENLQEQLHQKQNDIRQLIVKYNQLEKRLKEILQAQDRLSEFQKKIVNLGLDQNLVKNMSELFAKYRK